MVVGKLRFAMAVTLALLFGTLAAVLGLILWYAGPSLGLGAGLVTVVAFTLILTFVQWYAAPWLIKTFTRMRPLAEGDYPWLHSMVAELSQKAGIPKPSLYLVHDGTPNAFAFGRTKKSSNIAVHTGLLNVLSRDEVRAVLAHEVAHVRHWDVAVITLASVVPMLLYYLVILFGSQAMGPRERRSGFAVLAVWLGAYLAQFASMLLVRYLSRARESYADAFSAVVTNPRDMRTALAKISYGFPRGVDASAYKATRAFYIADPVTGSELANELARSERQRLQEGPAVSAAELDRAMEWERTSGAAKFMELLGTHPLTYKRLDNLKALEADIQAGRLTLSTL
jgi:heat shock protein HtpX